MKLLQSTLEMGVVGLFSLFFIGYAVFIYPIEMINQKTNRKVRENKVKYAPQLD
ncbi:hypothetical protein KO561_13130 [Radiobacillus kanasensis]|uniref:hypothetical protein n=1 Tax=Radiobacillus kanasensis TaxID=2844358 RepID=UPI001E3AF490|nr:hypothetical protein [Radiobacillus kanasensis]UFT98146.1 hypothetical protein KO561_13130 [Radiobacillus kanasensis]